MTYSAEVLRQLREELRTIPDKHAELMRAFLARRFATDDGREFAQHGFLRRIKAMARSLTNTFELLAPDLAEVPETDVVHDAELQIQAFVFNAFAATDNLAWVIVKERGLRLPNGAEIPRERIGLRPANAAVRDGVSADFRAYLATRDAWFRHMEDFRHALAHRVPLYIPPFCVDPANEVAYRELEQRKMRAAAEGRFDDYEVLSAEQAALGFFKPWMVHSLRQGARPVYFHAQLQADFNTVHEIALQTLAELDRA